MLVSLSLCDSSCQKILFEHVQFTHLSFVAKKIICKGTWKYFWMWWYFRYALVLIAMYNVWDFIGRNIPLMKSLKLESRKILMFAILSRFSLIPAFYFTAKYADQGWMIMLTSFLGLTNGYLTVCVLTSAPKGYKVRLL